MGQVAPPAPANNKSVGFLGLAMALIAVFEPSIAAQHAPAINDYVSAVGILAAYFGMPFTVAPR